MREAIANMKSDVETRAFPTEENTPGIDDEALEAIYGIVGKK
jgi:hypothetical protein